MYINGKKVLSVVKAEKPTGITTSDLTIEHAEAIRIDTKDLTLFKATLKGIFTPADTDVRDYYLWFNLYDVNNNLLTSFEGELGNLENVTILMYKDFALMYGASGNVLDSTKLSAAPAYITIYYEHRDETEFNSSNELVFEFEEL